MTSARGNETESRILPLVAVVSAVPMLSEALSDGLAGIAEVRAFPAGRADMAGLLRSLRPDAVIVDTDAEAETASAYAREAGAPAVLVSYGDAKLRVLEGNVWSECDADGLSAEAVRNVLVGRLFGRVGTVRAG
jgi:uncharacterized Rossmann fold enzyme